MARRVTMAEFARLKGVNRSTVTKWRQKGRIRVGADGKLDPDEAERELAASASPLPHHLTRTLSAEAGRSPDAGEIPGEDVALRLKMAMVREREAKAELAEMENLKRAGELVWRKDVERVLQDVATTWRTLLEAFPARIATELAGCGSDAAAIHHLLEGAVRDLLEEMSDHAARRQAEMAGEWEGEC